MQECTKEKSKGGLKIALVCLALLLIAVSEAEAIDSSSITSGNIVMRILDIRDETDSMIKINYGDTLRIRVVYPADSDSVQYLDILDRDYNNNLIERFILNSTGFQIVNIPASTYAPATNFTIRIYAGKTSEELRTDLLNVTIITRTSWPSISLTLKNPSDEIAEGDYVVIHGTVSISEYSWTLEGSYDYDKFSELASDAIVSGIKHSVNSWEREAVVTTDDHRIDIKLPTHSILDRCGGTGGHYTFRVWNAAYPGRVEEVDFRISELNVEIQVDKEIRLGERLRISGSTNIAETGSEFDDTSIGSNTVTIKVLKEETIANYTVRVGYDGNFEKELESSLDWETGTYTVLAIVTTGNEYSDEDSTFVEIKPPEVELEKKTHTPEVTTPEIKPVSSITEIPVSTKTPETPEKTPSIEVTETVTTETKEEKEIAEIPGFDLITLIAILLTLLYMRAKLQINNS